MPSTEFQSYLNALRNLGDQSAMTLDELRAATERKALPVPDDVTCTPVSAPGVRAEWSATPGASAAHVLLFFHGGGYYRGSIAAMRELSSRLARMGGMRGLSAAYRLAPEQKFPAAVEDALAAYRWLLAQGISAGNVIVSGASAGGGLALSLLLAAREEGLPLPAGAVVLSPWVDLTQSGETFATNAALDPVISKAYLDRFAGMYLGTADPTQPLASPIFGELAGLPPMLIQVGEAETMLDESRRFAAKARQAGVDVQLDAWPAMVHVWQACGPRVPEARDAVAQAGDWMRQRLGLPGR